MRTPDTQSTQATGPATARERGTWQPQLVMIIDRAHPFVAGARHSLANIELVTFGRGAKRSATRVLQEGKPTLQIRLPDVRVSRMHARLERRDGEWHFEDCGSTNGSRIDGSSIHRKVMAEADVLEIGFTFFRYRASVFAPADAPGDVDASDLRGLTKAFGTLLPGVSRDLATLSRLARSDVSVLLRGETGTGKEVLARAIHAESGRAGPFVAVNCGALPAPLVESLLFGHKRGAFTGATQDEQGLVRAAQGGTLFLDEIGDLALPAQASVLRMLQEREVIPLGATRPIATDLRVLAATHKPMEALVASGDFRQDLLARLSGYTYVVPSVRDRIDDMGLLVAVLLAKVANAVGDRARSMTLASDLIYAMLSHDWPFNVREMEQRLRTAVLLAGDDRIELAHVWKDGVPDARRSPSSVPARVRLSKGDDRLRTELVARLVEHRGNLTRVGETMGKRRTTIQRWIRRLGLDPNQFRE